MSIKILDETYECVAISRALTVPDCNVVGPNKIGTGNGEAKFYFGSKNEMNAFFGNEASVHCFFLKSDLAAYMEAIKNEYQHPSQQYAGGAEFATLWATRNTEVSTLEDAIYFDVQLQHQIAGPRGYLNSQDAGYKLFRTLSLPLTSYISIMKLAHPTFGTVYYWKLFVDFAAISQRQSQPLVFTYGRRSEQQAEPEPQPTPQPATQGRKGRDGQAEYRRKLLEECPFCPITMITDERLLIASHIKPHANCTESEKYDPNNGFPLSPLYDKLFDQGFLSFTDDRKMKISHWLTPATKDKCDLEEGRFIQMLPMNDKRAQYLDYHRQFVFKG